jgi:hypothetical protein
MLYKLKIEALDLEMQIWGAQATRSTTSHHQISSSTLHQLSNMPRSDGNCTAGDQSTTMPP